MTYDAIVIGAGIAGSVVARQLAERGGKQVLVIEQRDHIGGNCYDRTDEAGVLVHEYGPHIFHTNDEGVYEYLSRFTEWYLYPQGHQPDDAGKLLIWGRCMSYIRTYLEQRGGFDLPNTVFAGCSRFGKTALAGGLFDERIRHVASVCSGTAGTAILRGKVGETVENITKYAPFWFCDKFDAYSGREDDLPFDAHFIVAAFAPRNLLITGALEDFWCDPYWELLACVAGSPAHELLGMPGFLYEGPHPVPGYRYPVPGDFFHEGNIAYAMRAGGHGFFQEDWQRIVEFVSERKA